MGKSYSAEYREEAMKLVAEIGKKEAVKRLDVTEWTMNQWLKKAGQEKKEEASERTASLLDHRWFDFPQLYLFG